MASSSFAELRQRLLHARIQLALRHPFLASAVMRLPLREVDGASWCATMATDGYHVFYNPEWTGQLTDAQMRGVIAHEVLHALFGHGERQQHREPQRWNQACDHAINLLLLDQGFVLPPGLHDSRFIGQAAEEIYKQLQQSERKGHRGGTGPAQNDGALSGVVPDAGADLVSPDDPRVSPLRDADCPDREQLTTLRAALRQDAASKLHGHAAALFREECATSDQARVDWRALLRQWLHDRIKCDWSTYPFSKKHLHRGLFMPSMGVESPGHIVFAIDTSGSMSSECLGDIVGELRAFRETFPCRLTVIQADAAVQKVEEYEAFDGMEVPQTLEVRGRGGTSFVPVFDWMEAQGVDGGAVVIYATDGYGSFPQRVPGWGVVWLVTEGGVEKYPFGAVVQLTYA